MICQKNLHRTRRQRQKRPETQETSRNIKRAPELAFQCFDTVKRQASDIFS